VNGQPPDTRCEWEDSPIATPKKVIKEGLRRRARPSALIRGESIRSGEYIRPYFTSRQKERGVPSPHKSEKRVTIPFLQRELPTY